MLRSDVEALLYEGKITKDTICGSCGRKYRNHYIDYNTPITVTCIAGKTQGFSLTLSPERIHSNINNLLERIKIFIPNTNSCEL